MIDSIRTIDGHLLIAIQQLFLSDAATPVVTFITHLGDSGMVWIGIVLLMLLIRKTRKDGAWTLLALVVSTAINNVLLKNLIARTRPYEMFQAVQLLVERQSDYSFPSGHSAASFVVAVSIFLYLPRRYGIPALILAFLISLSRLYVGVHYPGDVLVGALSGTLIAILIAGCRKKFREKRNHPGGRHYKA